MTLSLNESISTYIRSNGGRSKASKASQSQLNSLGSVYSGRFNYGKMYTFQYFTVKEVNYDTNPIVLGLGPSVNGNELGLNLHYMPYNVRKSFLNRVWESYSNVIDKEIEGSNFGKPRNQSPLLGFNWTNLKDAYGAHLNLEHCVHQYKLGKIRNMRMLGYEDWYIAASNDENRFYGKNISEAQALYYNHDI